MFHRKGLLLVAGAAIFALEASAASAQDSTRTRRPTSTKRIPIAKEAHGEVAAPVVARVDTVTVYKTDTLRLQGRVDTVTTTNTVTRTDTVVQTVNLGPRMIGGMYFGLAGGTALPYARSAPSTTQAHSDSSSLVGRASIARSVFAAT